MNIIEESFVTKQKKKSKLLPTIILIVIILLVVGIIGIAITLAYIDDAQLKVYVDGRENSKLKEMFVFKSDATYVPIRDIAPYFGYQSYSGDYAERSEAKNKCFIEGENDIANFVLASNKVYKLEKTSSQSGYKYFYCKQPIASMDGKLYISTDGMEQAFNVSYNYNQETNRINIYTLDYLLASYENYVLDEGYASSSTEFNDTKAIFNSRLIVQSADKGIGVIDLDGNTIIEPKYDKITYIPETGDFYATNNGKVGIISKNGDMRVQILYDSLELIDMDAGIYVAEKEGKFGIIDVRGKTKLFMENDEIGMDVSPFEKNDVRSRYLLVDNLIPVRKDNLWGLFNKNGQKIVDFKYDKLGYVATSNKDALNLLIIPNYNLIVTCKGNKYGLINSSGEEIFPTQADDIYLTIEEETNRHYYLNYNNNRYDAEDWLDSIGVEATTNPSIQAPTNSTVIDNTIANETTE